MMIDTSSRTTEVPSEPGLYLFVGEVYFPCGLERGKSAEIVKVSLDSLGNVFLAGKDFYSPKELVGVWLRLDDPISELQSDADNAFVERAAIDLVPKLFTYGRTLFDLPQKLAKSCDRLAERVLARSIELGVVKDHTNYHILVRPLPTGV